MKFQILVELDNSYCGDDIINYVESQGEIWDVIPGVPLIEVDLPDFSALSNFMSTCEHIAGRPISFTMQTLTKTKETDEDMIIMSINDKQVF